MHSTLHKGLPPIQVVALFPDSIWSFSLSNGATFAELADRVDGLGERHVAGLTAIYLRMGIAQKPTSLLQSGL